jgi:predicted nucleotidyltransferase
MDTEGLLRSLNDHGVRFVVIGATAFPVHGYARATLDVDLLIEPTRENAERTLRALGAFGYDVSDVSVDDLLRFKVLIRQYVVAADVHPSAAGVTFEGVWQRSIRAPYGKTEVAFASLDDLIAMKEAAGRPKDQEDLRHLRALKRRLE